MWTFSYSGKTRAAKYSRFALVFFLYLTTRLLPLYIDDSNSSQKVHLLVRLRVLRIVRSLRMCIYTQCLLVRRLYLHIRLRHTSRELKKIYACREHSSIHIYNKSRDQKRVLLSHDDKCVSSLQDKKNQ